MGDVHLMPGVSRADLEPTGPEDVAAALTHAARAVANIASIVIVVRRTDGKPKLWCSSNNDDEITGLLMCGVDLSLSTSGYRLSPDGPPDDGGAA